MPEARAGHRNGRVNPPPRPTHRHGNEVMDAASSALALQTPPPIEIAMATECEGRPLRRHQLRRPEIDGLPAHEHEVTVEICDLGEDRANVRVCEIGHSSGFDPRRLTRTLRKAK